MTTYAGPAPATGDPDALDDLAGRCRRTAHGLRADVFLLRGAPRTAVWSGDAARSFTGSVHGLPRDLVRAADSYDTVARALAAYADDVRGAAPVLRRGHDELGAIAARLGLEQQSLVGPVGDAAAQAARVRRIAALEHEQAEIRCRVGTLAGDLERAAELAARAVRAASDAPQEPPGFLERLVDGVGDWVEDNASTLADLSDVLKGLAAVAGMLALVPALAPVCGPIAIGAGIGALVLDAALAARHRRSWAGVGLDAAVTAVPAARPAQAAVREVRTRLGSVVVYRVEGTPNARVVINRDNNVRFEKRSMLYINVGDKARAEQYYRRKLADGLPGVQIKSFRVSKRAFRELSFRAVSQERARGFPLAPHLVDTRVAANQFGLWKADFRELEKHIVPGSGRVLR